MSMLSDRQFKNILEAQRKRKAHEAYLKHGPTYIRTLEKAVDGHGYELVQTNVVSGESEVIFVKINDTKIRSKSDELYEAVDAADQTYLITKEQYDGFMENL